MWWCRGRWRTLTVSCRTWSSRTCRSRSRRGAGRTWRGDGAEEINRCFTALSRILELSGNPIAVLSGVVDSQDIAVEPGALWEMPEGTKAYLLDLLSGGGVKVHLDYLDAFYRPLQGVGKAPRRACRARYTAS